MSITATSQTGYSYQNDATAWLVLVLRDAKPLQVVADSGQEDATFMLTVAGVPRVIEAQMKTERGPVDEHLFAFWLAHFPDGQSTGSLLEQLQARADLNVLFVITAPCTDVVASLCITDPTEALRPRSTPNPPLLQKHAKRIIGAFSSAHTHRDPTKGLSKINFPVTVRWSIFPPKTG